jgi:voltage-gated potassium channel
MSTSADEIPRAERAERLERLFEWPLVVAALLVVPVVVLDETNATGFWGTFGGVLNWVVWSAFAVALVVLLIVTPHRGAWLRAHPIELAIVLLTPPILPAAFGALRLFRLLRLLRLGIFVHELRRFLTPSGVRLAAVLAAAAALGGGAIFAEAEQGHSLGDGVWWAVATMSTVGYGDLAPKTAIGRIVGACLMLIGIGFFALVTGALAQHFLAEKVTELEHEEERLVQSGGEARDEILTEIRAVSARLQQLERRVNDLL